MIVLKSYKMAMQVVGILFTYSESITYRLYRWISFIILSIMFQPSCLYLYVNYKDLIKATEVSVYLIVEGVMMAKFLFLTYNQNLVKLLFKDLQEIADEKIRLNRTKFLCQFHNEAETISKSFMGMLAIASVIFIGGPAAAILYRKFQGTYVAHMYGHPYKGFFPYDFESTPGYEITYGLIAIYNIYFATSFAACDLFLVNCGLHLIGATQDLQAFFIEIDLERKDEINQSYKQRNKENNDMAKDSLMSPLLVAKVNKGIVTHYKIINLTDILASVVQGLIFSQFFGVIFSLSAIAFQVVTSEGEQRFFFIAPTLVILSQLFLYCYYGQRVADEATKFSASIYQLHWYNYPAKYQKYFQLLMLRNQYPSYLSGFGFVKCSLESFSDVLKFAGSVVTLFRNLQN